MFIKLKEIYKILREHWRLVFVITGFSLIIILFMYFSGGADQDNQDDDVIVPSTTLTEEEISRQRNRIIERLPFEINSDISIVEISPAPPVFKSIWDTEPLQITFNYPVVVEDLRISITPEANFLAKNSIYDDRTINIIPYDGWRENVPYFVRIYSNDDDSLSFLIRRQVPRPGDPEYPDDREIGLPNEHAH